MLLKGLALRNGYNNELKDFLNEHPEQASLMGAARGLVERGCFDDQEKALQALVLIENKSIREKISKLTLTESKNSNRQYNMHATLKRAHEICESISPYLLSISNLLKIEVGMMNTLKSLINTLKSFNPLYNHRE